MSNNLDALNSLKHEVKHDPKLLEHVRPNCPLPPDVTPIDSYEIYVTPELRPFSRYFGYCETYFSGGKGNFGKRLPVFRSTQGAKYCLTYHMDAVYAFDRHLAKQKNMKPFFDVHPEYRKKGLVVVPEKEIFTYGTQLVVEADGEAFDSVLVQLGDGIKEPMSLEFSKYILGDKDSLSDSEYAERIYRIRKEHFPKKMLVKISLTAID